MIDTGRAEPPRTLKRRLVVSPELSGEHSDEQEKVTDMNDEDPAQLFAEDLLPPSQPRHARARSVEEPSQPRRAGSMLDEGRARLSGPRYEL